ncbi:cell growth regulator with EF hand domain protein 1 [Pundamilia nyererei]|uniref:Cell growth regulator with EF hand domain protein 1 n=1 Tax=Pundamilia nyererei TaxID=303518 RepID=A0A9Y3RF58_9CICH|nr:PREDICTED: cell growth regulator with EF hand domain protein 1 [Pundamilia nyererei]
MPFAAHTSTMQTGVLMECHLDQLVPRVLSLTLLVHLCLAAPGLPGTQREESVAAHPPSAALPNPFGSGEEERSLRQSYIQSSLKNGGQGGPEITTWEQEVFFLFGLYDYDRSGFLDGLEMMKLLSDFNSHHIPGAEASEQVVSMVDFLLQTQDLNQDGLLALSELLSPSITHTQDPSNNNAPQQEQEAVVEEQLSNAIANVDSAGAVEQRKEQIHEEIQLQEDVQGKEVEPIKQMDEYERHQIPEVTIEDLGQDHNIPVHQGQPEI